MLIDSHEEQMALARMERNMIKMWDLTYGELQKMPYRVIQEWILMDHEDAARKRFNTMVNGNKGDNRWERQQ